MVRIRPIKFVLVTDDDRKPRVELELGTNTRFPTEIVADTPEEAMTELANRINASDAIRVGG